MKINPLRDETVPTPDAEASTEEARSFHQVVTRNRERIADGFRRQAQMIDRLPEHLAAPMRRNLEALHELSAIEIDTANRLEDMHHRQMFHMAETIGVRAVEDLGECGYDREDFEKAAAVYLEDGADFSPIETEMPGMETIQYAYALAINAMAILEQEGFEPPHRTDMIEAAWARLEENCSVDDRAAGLEALLAFHEESLEEAEDPRTLH
jgi:hypothetical protein